jgi:predicted DNA-binding transcriptional regulator AlpA
MSITEPLWGTKDLARFTGGAESTWEKKRLTGDGPPYLKIGRHVRYRPSDVEAWLAKQVRQSTSGTGEATK